MLTKKSTSTIKDLMRLGDLVQAERIRRGLSLRDLADKLYMNYSHLYRIEEGERFPLRRDYVLALADFVGKPPNEILQMVSNDKVQSQLEKIDEEPKFLSIQEIESYADEDRKEFLTRIGRNQFNFPKDRKLIPWILYKLDVTEEEVLFGADTSEIFAGLFVGDYTYSGKKNVIAVATRNVVEEYGENVSVKTLAFQILHEMGHYRLHWLKQKNKVSAPQLSQKPLYCSSFDNSSRIERQANMYAGAFLMPRVEILSILGSKKSISMQKEGFDLCEHFFVESWTLKKRLKDLGIKVNCGRFGIDTRRNRLR